MKLSDILRTTTERLKNSGVNNVHLDARLLFCHALAVDRAQLLSQSERILTAPEIEKINALIARREKREPIARIIGKREFWGLEFGLNEATLEPRPDSETLIEAVLKLYTPPLTPPARGGELRSYRFDISSLLSKEEKQQCSNSGAIPIPLREGLGVGFPKILDLGTGSGCLLLALLHESPNATGIGIDISSRAVEQATQNATHLGLSARAKFHTGNWLEGITEKFDIIISNPPYIPAPDIPNLMPEVRDYDPARALDGGTDGLAPYRYIIPQLPHFLKPQGIAAVEFGQGQAKAVIDLFGTNGFIHIETHKDLGEIERCITAFLG